jgi:hypothetical protein
VSGSGGKVPSPTTVLTCDEFPSKQRASPMSPHVKPMARTPPSSDFFSDAKRKEDERQRMAVGAGNGKQLFFQAQPERLVTWSVPYGKS